MRKVFIFDLDDTLYWNKHDYCYPILEFEKFILDVLDHKAPHVSVIRKIEGEIDKRRVHEINPKTGEKFGYSIDRFPGTLVETYRTICSKERLEFKQEIADEIWKIGTKAFDPNLYRRKGLVRGAREVLNFLKKQDDYLILLSRGDNCVQQLKIDNLGLAKWFWEIQIVSSKSKETFRDIKVTMNLPLLKIYSVGNSFESDIKPALEAGLLGIYIPHETWEFQEEQEKILKEIDSKQLFVFEEIIEIKNRYTEL